MNLTIFCASSENVHQKYFDSAAAIGKELATRKVNIVYGGGNIGLMGALANAALENGGYVIGVIPHFMKEWERNHTGIQETIFTKTMQKRKRILLEKGDGVLVLPGGVGTMDELFEALTLKRLNRYDKPVIIFNQNGFYNHLLVQLELFAEEKFTNINNLIFIAETIPEIFDILNSNHKP